MNLPYVIDNRELVLTHNTILAPEEIQDGEARASIAPLLEAARPLGFSTLESALSTGKPQRSSGGWQYLR